MRKKDERAFPVPSNVMPNLECYGLTKRELIAAMAMQGLLSDCGHMDFERMNFSKFARAAVDCADALLKELCKTEESK